MRIFLNLVKKHKSIIGISEPDACISRQRKIEIVSCPHVSENPPTLSVFYQIDLNDITEHFTGTMSNNKRFAGLTCAGHDKNLIAACPEIFINS